MEFTRLRSADHPLFEAAFALYTASFPVHEQREAAQQRALMGHPLYHFDVLLEGGAVAGILLHWALSGYSYVEHFAIDPARRGNAIGSRALQAFCAAHARVVLEIDPPVDDVSIRREGFYTRLGFCKTPYDHRHPAYRPQYTPHSLVVMSYPESLGQEAYAIFAEELSCIVMNAPPQTPNIWYNE